MTDLYLRRSLTVATDTHTGEDAGAYGAGAHYSPLDLLTSPGSSAYTSEGSLSYAGPISFTPSRCDAVISGARKWISPPLAADVTISGTIAVNVWAYESDMMANMLLGMIVERVSNTCAVASTVWDSRDDTELGTSSAAMTWSGTPTSTAFNRGDRIQIKMVFDDAGTMAAGYFGYISYDGGTPSADGDSYVSFTETLTFESAPAGSTLYMTTTGAGIDPGAADEREMWTSRGSGVTTAVTNTTKNYGRAELAVCNSDGSGATVWSAANFTRYDTFDGHALWPSGGEAARAIILGGDSVSVTDGQRLRLRLYSYDGSATDQLTASAGGSTIEWYSKQLQAFTLQGRADLNIRGVDAGTQITFYYAGTSGGASGDSYLTLGQSVSEYVTTVPIPTLVQARRI